MENKNTIDYTAAESPKKKRSMKAVIIRIAVIFAVVVVLLTYFSNTIDNYLLPHVTVTFGGSGTLKYALRTSSVIEPPQPIAFAAPVSIPVGNIAVEEGMTVSRGDRLVQYEAQAFADAKDAFTQNVEHMKKEFEEIYSVFQYAKDEASALQAGDKLQELQNEYEAAQAEYDDFVIRFDSEGWILADQTMQITEITAKVGETVSEGEALLYFSGDSDALQFSFLCEPEQGDYIRIGSKLEIKAAIETAKDEYAYRKGKAVVVGKKQSGDGIRFTAEITEVKLGDGEKMPVYGNEVLIATDFESKQYGHIVMKSAIQNGSYVYMVGRDENDKRFVSIVPVTVLAENDFYAAVDMTSEPLPIVLTASKEIRDGQRVIVDG